MDLKPIGEAFLEGIRTDLEATLDELEVRGDAARALAADITALAGVALAARIAGEDVDIAEAALKAAGMNLAAIATVQIANSVLNVAKQAALRAAGGLVSILV